MYNVSYLQWIPNVKAYISHRKHNLQSNTFVKKAIEIVNSSKQLSPPEHP